MEILMHHENFLQILTKQSKCQSFIAQVLCTKQYRGNDYDCQLFIDKEIDLMHVDLAMMDNYACNYIHYDNNIYFMCIIIVQLVDTCM